MKKTYSTPIAKLVDFSYDEQVVAMSTKCNNYSVWGIENPTTCTAELKDVPQATPSPMARIGVVGCVLYMDDYVG